MWDMYTMRGAATGSNNTEEKRRTAVIILSNLRIVRYRGSRGDRKKVRAIGMVNAPHRCPQWPSSQRHQFRVVDRGCLVQVEMGPTYTDATRAQRQPRFADTFLPGIYNICMINACSVVKPHALDQLNADLTGYDLRLAIVTETHLKKHHSQDILSRINGCQLWIAWIGWDVVLEEELRSLFGQQSKWCQATCAHLSCSGPGWFCRVEFCLSGHDITPKADFRNRSPPRKTGEVCGGFHHDGSVTALVRAVWWSALA